MRKSRSVGRLASGSGYTIVDDSKRMPVRHDGKDERKTAEQVDSFTIASLYQLGL